VAQCSTGGLQKKGAPFSLAIIGMSAARKRPAKGALAGTFTDMPNSNVMSKKSKYADAAAARAAEEADPGAQFTAVMRRALSDGGGGGGGGGGESSGGDGDNGESGSGGGDGGADGFLHTEFYLTRARAEADHPAANIHPEKQAGLRWETPSLCLYDSLNTASIPPAQTADAVGSMLAADLGALTCRASWPPWLRPRPLLRGLPRSAAAAARRGAWPCSRAGRRA